MRCQDHTDIVSPDCLKAAHAQKRVKALSRRRSFHRQIEKIVNCKAFALRGFGVCFVAITYLFVPFTPCLSAVAAKSSPAYPQPWSESKQPDQKETPAGPANPSEDRVIPLPKIADRAEELDHLLREIGTQLKSKTELQESEAKAAEQAVEIRRRAMQTTDLLVGAPTPLELEDEQRYWRARNVEYEKERRLLTSHATKLETQIQTLEAQQPDWVATWKHIRESLGIEPVIERTKQQVDKIERTKSEAREQLKVVLKLQNEVSQQDQQVLDLLFRVREAREGQYSHLFEPDSPPVWKAGESREPAQSVRLALLRSFDRLFTTTGEFWQAHKLAIPTIVGCYALILFCVFKLRHYVRERLEPQVPASTLHMLSRPFSIALLLTMIGAGRFIASAPIGIAFLFYLLSLIPVLRTLAPLIELRLRKCLYVVAALYGLEGTYLLLRLPPALKRELYALLLAIALISIAWLAGPSKVLQVAMHPRSRRMLVIGIQTVFLLLAAALIANLLGFASLSQVLGMTALVGPFMACTLYCAARVLAMNLGILLRTHWARTLLEVRIDAVERWSTRFLGLGALFLWLKSMFQLVTLRDRIVEAFIQLLRYPIGFEKIHFTLGDALGVPLVLVGGYFFAKVFTFLLKTVLLPKLPLQRGLPYAISTVAYYLLLVLVAVAALSGAGVELNKFTVMTGALGVGLGFGLQNVVNNFVSGLILLFERPIRVGDTVDVGGLVGTVRRIGARSSTVLTYQGAEVIVPNSNLLSNQVINWTLSSQWRRVDVPVRVAYGNDPERVIKLLVGVAESNPDVLTARPPKAFFMGFGESSLNFELQFWSPWQDKWFQLQSDVAIAVARALQEANIEIPVPQRDLRVRAFEAPMENSTGEASTVAVPKRNAAW